MLEVQTVKIHVGTSGFGYKEWKGKFYPAKIDPKEMLRYYSERLGAVEINNTFNHMPTEGILTSWAEQVPDNFIFAFKAPQVITHLKQLRNVSEETDYLFRTLSVLGAKLGPVLFQFPKSFRADQPALHKKGCSLCIEDTDQNPTDKIFKTATWGYLRLRRSDYTDADLSQWLERISSPQWKKVFVFFKHEDQAKGPEMALRFRELAGSDARK